jgi:ribosome-associated heat shock protein Hsp15
VKSRTGAQRLTVEGKVRVNREKTLSASHLVRPGDVITIALPRATRVLKVLLPGERRGPAEEAATLFEDLSPPAEVKPSPALRSGPGAGRPTKRDRRAIDALKRGAGEDIPEDWE